MPPADGRQHRVGGTDAEWDERYASSERVWSGDPNGALVTELEGVPPGRALDVGCGEGSDAIWLAQRGWEVWALDVAGRAERAKSAGAEAEVGVRWIHSGLLDADLPSEGFDLVSAQYPALRATQDHDAERGLVGAVAPGGLLLVVHHADVDTEAAKAAGFDPADYVNPGDVASVLPDGWQSTIDEHRPRSVSGGAGARHRHDTVLSARRPT